MYNVWVDLLDIVCDMQQKKPKTTPDSSHEKKPLRSILINATIAAATLAGVFCAQPGYNQNSKAPIDNKKKDTWDLVIEKDTWTFLTKNTTTASYDTLDHQTIITTPVDSIFLKYWQEKWLEIIREHTLKEINIFREKHNLPACTMDPLLQDVSLEYAKFISKKKQLTHIDDKGRGLRERLIAVNHSFIMCGETLAYWQKTISDLVHIRTVESIPHKDVIMEKRNFTEIHYKKAGIAFYKNFRVMSLSD